MISHYKFLSWPAHFLFLKQVVKHRNWNFKSWKPLKFNFLTMKKYDHPIYLIWKCDIYKTDCLEHSCILYNLVPADLHKDTLIYLLADQQINCCWIDILIIKKSFVNSIERYKSWILTEQILKLNNYLPNMYIIKQE